MACSITISNVVGTVSGANLTSLTVSGVVIDCVNINVSVICGSGGGSLTGTAAGSVTQSTWSITFSGAALSGFNCTCGQTVEVQATCATDPTCRTVRAETILCPDEGPNSYDCTKTYKKWFCPLVFTIMTIAFALAIALLLLASCSGLSAIATVLGNVGAGLLLLGFLGLGTYYLLCGKCQCGWVLRLLWRVLFAVGVIAITFAGCCASFLLAGAILVLAGVAALIWWARRCGLTRCDILKELILVFAVLIVPVITFALGLGAPLTCLLALFQFGSTPFTVADLILIILFGVTVYEQATC
jgi:hypothetical protein